jgi:hypothetical protein
MRFAHVLNGRVDNVSVWDHIPTAEERAFYAEELLDVTNIDCGPEWSYDPVTGVFSPPQE